MSEPNTSGVGSGPYEGPQFEQLLTVAFSSIAFYNVVELFLLAFDTFKRYTGVYFWSTLVATLGIFLHSLAFFLKFLNIVTNDIVCTVIVTIGWYGMVTGQAIALWSRLHLVIYSNAAIIRYILYMIIIDAFLFHIPTTVLTFGSNSADERHFIRAFNAMEKIQMTAFVLQECIISGTFLYYMVNMARASRKISSKRIIRDAIIVNICVIALDIALLSCEYANLYVIEATSKAMVYSIKLKAEFLILNRLRDHVVSPNASMGNYVSHNEILALSINVQKETIVETDSMGPEEAGNGENHDDGRVMASKVLFPPHLEKGDRVRDERISYDEEKAVL